MEINGKIYRNLEGQVGYLTDKYGDLQDQIDDIRAHLTHYVIVETLPTEDIDTSAVYLVGPKGTAPDTYYEEWVYVETSSSTWSWEKLGDTASVDLSGYLEKVTTVTTERQVYAKAADGTQTMIDTAQSVVGGAIPIRSSAGHILVPTTPNNDSYATSKKYVDDTFVPKDTTVTTYAKAYIKKGDGSQDTLSMANTPNQGFIVQYNTSGTLRCKDPIGNGEDAVNLSYANSNYVAKQTGTTSFRQAYAKATDGSQYMQVINGKDMDAGVDRVACYGTDGRLRVGEPVNAKDAATKGYVDAAVGQLLYLHDINLVISVDATNKLFVKAYLVSSTSTAYTSFDRQLYRRIDVQWGAFGVDLPNAVAVAVTKLPDGFRQDEFDEPFIGFLYQYLSGGNLVSAYADSNMSVTITDTVTSF